MSAFDLAILDMRKLRKELLLAEQEVAAARVVVRAAEKRYAETEKRYEWMRQTLDLPVKWWVGDALGVNDDRP